MRTSSPSQKAQALTEFALVLVLFLFIVMVIFDLSRVIFFYSVVHNAAREGARYGSTDPTAANIENAIRQNAVGMDLDTTVQINPESIHVEVEYTFDPATPVLFILTNSGDFTIRSEADMAREN